VADLKVRPTYEASPAGKVLALGMAQDTQRALSRPNLVWTRSKLLDPGRMNVKKWASVVVIAALSAACGGGAQPAENAEVTAPPTAEGTGGVLERAAAAVGVPQYREVTVPAGTTLRLELTSSVASESSKVEDLVSAELRQPITIDGREVVPAGTDVTGRVTAVERSGRVKGRARVAFRFDSMSVAGDEYEIDTATIARQAEATKGEDATKIGVGAAAGAAIGGLLGGGDGAAKGAAIGGAGGTGVVLATRGREVRLGPGASVNARLTSPLVVRVKVS
jgi:hypothetical protein